MRRLIACLFVLALAACNGGSSSGFAEFWRPISEQNMQLPLEKSQLKLEFDLSKCRCGILPVNVPQQDMIAWQPDQQRLAETSITKTEDEEGQCVQRPSLEVAECMRARGWEVTQCSGRMALPGGGAMCAGTVLPTP